MSTPGRKRRLVSKAEVARLAGVTPQSISSACRRSLAPAVFSKKIDLNHPAAVAYMSGRNTSTTDGNNPAVPDEDNGDSNSEVIITADMSNNVGDFMDNTLSEILTTFKTVDNFQTWLKSIKLIADIMDRRIRIDERSGKLVPKEMVVNGIINPVESAHAGLLRDGSVTIAVTASRMSMAGSSEAEIRKAVQSILSGFISGLKESMVGHINKSRDGETNDDHE